MSNKGFTMIEMIFVLLIITIFVSLTCLYFPNVSAQKFKYVYELLLSTQVDSLNNHVVNEVTFDNHYLWINNQSYDLSPLKCDYISFHYNEQGNISQANTLTCYGKKTYQMKFQLGTGWISYEQ